VPKHKCPEPEPDNSKAWLDSYADAMTLLLAFFILLFAFSLVDQKKFQEFRAGVHLAAGKAAPALDGGDGILDLGTGISAMVVTPPVLIDGEKADVQPEVEEVIEGLGEVDEEEAPELFELLEERLATIGATGFVELERTPRGVVVRMDSTVLYQSGSAQIVPDGVTILESLGPVLLAVDNPIAVEGHTDALPTNGGGGFVTNWELSSMRAVSVLRYMNEFMDVPGVRLSAAGFADTQPRADNSTEEGRSQNRRVELVVLIGDDELDVIPKLDQAVAAQQQGDADTTSDAGDSEDAPPPEPSIVNIEPNIRPNLPRPTQ
jgi:chemotaxis protein MotB